MTDQFTPEHVGAMAKGLTKTEQGALVPMTVFSDVTKRSLIAKGLIAEADEVIHHTSLGLAVRQHLQAPGTQSESGAGPSPVTNGSAPAVASKPTRRKDS